MLIIRSGMILGGKTVLRRVPNQRITELSSILWECRCKCGAQSILSQNALKKLTPTCIKCRNEMVKKAKQVTDKTPTTKLSIFRQLQKSALKSGIPFDLTLYQYHQISDKPCYFCETESYRPPHQVRRKFQDFGFTLSNCIPVCKECLSS